MTDVKRLLEEASPLPWRVDRKPDGQTYGVVVAECQWSFVWAKGNGNDWGGEEHARLIGERDAALIVHAVNSLPDYEAAADALERIRQKMSDWQDAVQEAGVYDARAADTLMGKWVHDEAHAALRRLRGDR